MYTIKLYLPVCSSAVVEELASAISLGSVLTAII